MKKFWKPLCWAVLIALLSFMPTNDLETQKWFNIPFEDKILHALFYAIFAFLIIRSLSSLFNKSKPFWVQIIITILVVLVYGSMIEIIQDRFTVSRQGDVLDLVFNLVGCFIAILFVLIIPYFRPSVKAKE